jgi:hypothetical protein
MLSSVSFAWTITSMVVAPKDALCTGGAAGGWAGAGAASVSAALVCAGGGKTGGT